MLHKGKANFIIDGQFGSTGKGLMSGYIGSKFEIDIAVTNASANAGHTCVGVPGFGSEPVVLFHLPMSALFQPDARIYLNAGAIIDPDILLGEMETCNIDPNRVYIHPRAAVIKHSHVLLEQGDNSAATKIGSTRHGVGAAIADKIMRSATLARDEPRLKHFSFVDHWYLINALSHGKTAFVEVPQGYSLSLNSSQFYPYCTSREVTVTQALSDCGLPPQFLGTVTMTARTFPIRVGNIYDGAGSRVGYSGGVYPDSREISWEDIGQKPELTTVTKRPRRLFTFSPTQYRDSIMQLRPDYVFMNFMNYLPTSKIGPIHKDFFAMLDKYKRPTHYGYGPNIGDIVVGYGVDG